MSTSVRGACCLVVSLLLLVSALPAAADQPQGVGWKINRSTTPRSGIFRPGPGAEPDHVVNARLFASHEELMKSVLLVTFPGCGEDPPTAGRPMVNFENFMNGKDQSPLYVEGWTDPGPRWRMCAATPAVLILPGQSADARFGVDFLRAVTEGVSPRIRGKVHEIPRAVFRKVKDPARLASMMAGEQPVSEAIIDLYYRLDAERLAWRLGTYGKIFGLGAPPEVAEAPFETGDYGRMAAELPVVARMFRRFIPIPPVSEDGGAALFKNTLAQIDVLGSGQAGMRDCIQDEDFSGQRQFARPLEVQEGGGGFGAATYYLSGVFSTKWATDHSLHPGFGFRAEAWTLEGATWRKLASDWVQADGTWYLTVPLSAGYSGANLRMLYRSYNDYYRPMDGDDNTYSWRDPDQYSIPTTFSAGHRYADCDGNAYNGLGELVEAAMYTWSRLYWIGGIDPVHPSSVGPINFYYPNSWYDCGDGTGVPWSCSDREQPKIWLIAAHGTEAEVVTHELGHQLNNKYWDWKRPAGSGGSHSLTGCYPTRLGMALREGFANFLAAWVGFPDRNVADGGFGAGRWALGFDAESRVAPPACANGWENEVWVARTFWDLHDTRTDGDDILWYVHRGAAAALYLGNGIASSDDARDMRDYESIYRAHCSAGHEGFISDIFSQNRQ